MALPVKRPTACTFGGDQLEHLYVTTRVETGALLLQGSTAARIGGTLLGPIPSFSLQG